MACLIFVVEKAGKDVFLEYNKKSGMEHVKAAEEFGMGSSDYEIVKV